MVGCLEIFILHETADNFANNGPAAAGFVWLVRRHHMNCVHFGKGSDFLSIIMPQSGIAELFTK